MTDKNAIINDNSQEPDTDLYLASSSPRRRELLQQLGLRYHKVNAPVEEVALPGESPPSFVRRMAVEKALNGFQKVPGAQVWVIGGDTLIHVDGKVLGKPRHRQEGLAMLKRLSGRSHDVYSAVAVVNDGAVFSALNHTRVWFRALSEQEAQAYWDTGEPQGKAGSYAIQGRGAGFVERLDGSYSAVMGLPLFELDRLLNESGFWSKHV
jgi:septum formation protein